MAFNIKRTADFALKVTVSTPVAGKWIEETLTLTVKRLSMEQLEPLRKEGDAAIVREVVRGWDGITDDDGNPVEFNEENLEGFLLIPAAVRASVLAYLAAISGVREKN